ncbi:MAG TPA: NADP-dependent oxidoreductase [Blastocatellia bacterium]|nr:NADP-dependent oxidoreductase [Blastocatellia bacterium]
MSAKANRQWRLAARPVGMIKETDFQLTESPMPSPGDGEFLVRNIYLSLDPTNRGWVNNVDTYLPAVGIGDVMRGGSIGVVEQSRNARFPEGTIVSGLFGWQNYAVSDGQGVTALPRLPFVPLTAFLGLFGHIGLTAYYGLLDVGKPKAGETLVVSAAAGAVGSLVGQIGKIVGCRVVGIAGGEEKCRWITEELGFDAAIDYKAEPVLEGLKRHCPDGIDVDFENVGGEILDAVLSLINLKARISLCGLISQYNATKPVPGPYNFVQILVKRARVEGFIVMDYMDRAEEAMTALGRWLMEGKIKYRVDVVDGLEHAPSALNKLFDGSNKGKLIVKLSEEPAS